MQESILWLKVASLWVWLGGLSQSWSLIQQTPSQIPRHSKIITISEATSWKQQWMVLQMDQRSRPKLFFKTPTMSAFTHVFYNFSHRASRFAVTAIRCPCVTVSLPTRTKTENQGEGLASLLPSQQCHCLFVSPWAGPVHISLCSSPASTPLAGLPWGKPFNKDNRSGV